MIPPNKLSNVTQESKVKMPEPETPSGPLKVEAKPQDISNSLETQEDSKFSLAHLLKQPQLQLSKEDTSDGPSFKDMPPQIDVREKSNSMMNPKFRSF